MAFLALTAGGGLFASAATAAATAGVSALTDRKSRKADKSRRTGEAAASKSALLADQVKAKRERVKKAGLSRTKGGSLLTGSRGLTESANVGQKRLLGE